MITLLCDGNNLAAKSFHAMRNLKTSEGVGTGAVFGALNSLYRLISRLRPDALAVMWDIGKSQWRTKLYPEYKAHRHDKSEEEVAEYEEYHRQIKEIRTGFELLDITQVGIYGVEADDLVGIATTRILKEKPDSKIIIASSDKDFYQLLRPNVRVLRDWKTRLDLMTLTRFLKEYQFDPIFWPDVLALMGDKDEVPGIKGIGEKRAMDLVRRFGTVQDMFKAKHNAADRFLSSVQVEEKRVRLNKTLATITRNSSVFPIETAEKISLAMQQVVWPKKRHIDKIGFQRFAFDKEMMSVVKMRTSYYKAFEGVQYV